VPRFIGNGQADQMKGTERGRSFIPRASPRPRKRATFHHVSTISKRRGKRRQASRPLRCQPSWSAATLAPSRSEKKTGGHRRWFLPQPWTGKHAVKVYARRPAYDDDGERNPCCSNDFFLFSRIHHIRNAAHKVAGRFKRLRWLAHRSVRQAIRAPNTAIFSAGSKNGRGAAAAPYYAYQQGPIGSVRFPRERTNKGAEPLPTFRKRRFGALKLTWRGGKKKRASFALVSSDGRRFGLRRQR